MLKYQQKKLSLKQGVIMIISPVFDKKNLALMSFHADCNAVFFYDPVKKLIGLSHAGWRGTITDIGGKMVKALMEMGSNPSDLKAAISPSLCQDCFEVDKDVADMFISADSNYKDFMITRRNMFLRIICST
jgi:YfiH family protein